MNLLKNLFATATAQSKRIHVSCIFLALLVPTGLMAVEVTTAAQAPRQSVKLLTVGNSFADNALALLPELAKAGGKQITIFRANLGGHSFQQHASYVQAFEADPGDPKGHAYKQRIDPRTGAKKDFSLREALESADWDVVTIQQVSNFSFQPETFQPYANLLIDYIRKYAPHAEILIFETWAYPDDYYAKFKVANLDQKTMYAGVKAAYTKLSEQTGLRIIPVGDAFQAARALPSSIELNKTGDKHANTNGEYLAGAVFYEMIFRDNVEAAVSTPQKMSAEDAKALRHVAHATVAASKTKTGSGK